jgi:alginate O-acetyltransferase complex protein AlgI
LFAFYLTLKNRPTAKKWTLLIASAFFYAWGEPIFVPILFASCLIDYWLTARLYQATDPSVRHSLVMTGVIGNLLVLGFYKYADFLIDNLNLLAEPLTGSKIPLLHLALPIGVSFVVFEKITYLVDTYRGTSAPAPRFLDYGLFVFFFPKLLAGPILKYHDMQAQIAEPPEIQAADVFFGMARFARGVAKKLLIADPLGVYVDRVFATDPTSLGAVTAWFGLLCFYLQIYFDFSGYSDMAIGLARTLSFKLKENFRMPLISQSMTEFWKRWHISLATWIRDYLYVALGRNRHGQVRFYINLWICFLACGLWHGPNWTFVLWGAYNGMFLILDRLFLLKVLKQAGPVVATLTTLTFVTFGGAMFRSPSIQHFAEYTLALGRWDFNSPVKMPADVPLLATIALTLSLLPGTPIYDPLRRVYERSTSLQVAGGLALIALGILAFAQGLGVSFKPFIYFRF